MRTGEYRSPYRITVRIQPDIDRMAEIVVSKYLSYDCLPSWEIAVVNWPGIGSVRAEDAEAFAAALVEAAKVAQQLDGEFPAGSPVNVKVT